MADFDFSTLITDRGQSDLATLRSVLSTPMEEWTAEQLTAFNQAASRGAYNYTDLNRVTACMDNLNERLTALGYVTGYQQIVIHSQPPSPSPTLPEGYKELEYIQSSGTQYIDTGFKPNQDTRIIVDFEKISVIGQWADPIYGVRKSASSNAYYFWCPGNSSSTKDKFQFGYNNQTIYLGENIIGRHHVDQNKNIITVDGESSQANYSKFATSWNLLLFQSYDNGRLRENGSNVRLFYCKIYDNGNLIRDYLPCINPSSEIGLYDLVGKKFYGNAGSGVFAAGPEIPPEPEPEPLDPYTWYEEDVPTESTMAGYLANVSALREVLTLPENTAEVPADMAGLTLAEANAIEEILLVIEDYLTALASVFRRCGAAICGGPGFYFKN